MVDPFTAIKDGARHAAYQAMLTRGPVHRIETPASGVDWLVTGRIALGSLVAGFPALRLAVPSNQLDRTTGLLMNALAALPVLTGAESG